MYKPLRVESTGCGQIATEGGIMPLKALRSVLEEEGLWIPVVEEPSPLLLGGVGVSLNLIPLTRERVDNLALDVSDDLHS